MLTTFLLMYVPKNSRLSKYTFVKDFGSKLFYSAVRHTDTNFFQNILKTNVKRNGADCVLSSVPFLLFYQDK